MPGGDSDPTRLIDHANCSAADVYATEERPWVPDYPDAHTSKLVNYEALAPWLHTCRMADIDVIAVFTDTRLLSDIAA